MGSSTHNKTSQVYEKTGFYPFNGVAMWNRKISIYKTFHKKYFFAFLCKNKTGKKVSGVARWKLNIYSKHSSNKVKTKRKKTKVVLGNKNIYPRQRRQKDVAAFHTPGSRGKNLEATRCVLGGKPRVKAVTLLLTRPFRLNS